MDSYQSDDANIVLYRDPGGKTDVKLLARDGRIWLTQAQISDLFGTSIPNVNQHIRHILESGELEKSSVIKSYLITAADGKEDMESLKEKLSHSVLDDSGVGRIIAPMILLFYE